MYGDQIYKGTAEVKATREWWRGGVYCWGCVKTDGYAQPIWPLSSYSWPSWLRREKSFCWCTSDKVGLRLYLISIISELRQSGILKRWDVGHSVTGTVESVMWMWNSVFAYVLHLWGFFSHSDKTHWKWFINDINTCTSPCNLQPHNDYINY